MDLYSWQARKVYADNPNFICLEAILSTCLPLYLIYVIYKQLIKCIRRIINIVNVFGTAADGSAPADGAAHHPHDFPSHNTVPGSSASAMQPILFSNCQIAQVGQAGGRALAWSPIRPTEPEFRGTESPKPLIDTVTSRASSAASGLSRKSGRKNAQSGAVFGERPKS